MQGQQLLTESQVFEDEVFPRTKSPDNPAEDIPERHDHGKNLIGTVGIETFAKSLILRVYDVLARHSPWRIQAEIDDDWAISRSKGVRYCASCWWRRPKLLRAAFQNGAISMSI